MLFILKYIPYAALYLTFRILEWFASLFGLIPTAKRLKRQEKQAESKTDFQKTVEVRTVIWRHNTNLAYPASPWDFVSWPSGTANKDNVLKDNVSLYCVTESQVWFVETPCDMNIFSSDTDPFLYVSQFKWARKLYVVPIDVLIALGDFVGQPKVPAVLISSHGRCGSTLLAQVFETVPGVVTLAEPDVLTNVLWLKWRERITTDQLRHIVTALMKIMCRPMASKEVSLYCIKTRSPCISVVDIIAESVPSIKHLFLYRNCAKAVSSMERSFAQGLDVVEFWYRQLMAIFAVFDMTNHRYESITDSEFMATVAHVQYKCIQPMCIQSMCSIVFVSNC